MNQTNLISPFLCQAVIQMLLLLAGDVEQNPGPPKILKQTFYLGIHHLKDIHEELIHVSHKWYDIGLQLNLPVGTLQKIREQFADPQTCLREMLNKWLVTVNPYPTWRTLVKVLKRRAVEEHSLADEIKAKHCKGKGKGRTRADSLPKAHARVELVKVKQEPSDDSVENYKEGSLPDEVTSQPLDSESLNPSERVASGQDTGSSSTVTHQHHRTPVFGCGCKLCTIANFMDGCQKPITTKTGLPYLDASGLTEDQKSILVGRLLDESQEMLFAFQRLLSTARRSLIRQKIPPEDLVAELMSLDALDSVLSKAMAQVTPVFRECQKELQEAKSINEVFFAIHDYFSFFNYKIIEHIIAVFGTKDDQEQVQNYKETFERYCKRRVFECPPHIYGSRSESGHARLVVKKDNVLSNFSINELKVFQYKLCRILQVTECTLQLLSVEEGCLQLTFQIPSFVQHLIFSLSEDQKTSLRAEGVLVLRCGDYKFPAQEHAEDEVATNTSLDIPTNMLNDAAAMLDSVYDAVYSQTEMEFFNLASNDSPGIPLQHLGLEHELLGDCHKRKLEEQQWEEDWEEELILGLKRSRLQEDSAGVHVDLKPLDIEQELPVGTPGSILEESVKSEVSRAERVRVEGEAIKPKVKDPGMESKPKTEADPEFGIKTEQWMKKEDLVKKKMKMEWIPSTECKVVSQQIEIESKDIMKENVEDPWDSVTKLEAIDPGLYRVISANTLRLQAQNNVLEEEVACKEKELARKDDLIATNHKQIAELQQQIHALQPAVEMPEEQLDIPTTVPAVGMRMTSPDSEEQKLIQELLEQFTEGPSESLDVDVESSAQLGTEFQPEDGPSESLDVDVESSAQLGTEFQPEDGFECDMDTFIQNEMEFNHGEPHFHLRQPTSAPSDPTPHSAVPDESLAVYEVQHPTFANISSAKTPPSISRRYSVTDTPLAFSLPSTPTTVDTEATGSPKLSPPKKSIMQPDPTLKEAAMPAALVGIPYPIPIPATIPSYPTQQWHQYVKPDLRQHLVRKIVEAVYPVWDPMALQDKRVARLVEYAMKVENAMFKSSTSRDEYFQLLAEKIYRIRKELEEGRKEMEYRRTQIGVDELKNALSPVFDAVWNQIPESYPFRQPLVPMSLEYRDPMCNIIKNPMDLCTISAKLEEGKYKTPWEFCRDMWLMSDNTRLYYKKTSHVYKCCTKLMEVFDSAIDYAMHSLGYCCGKRYTFYPQVLSCYGEPLCTIPRDTMYYGYQNSPYVYCPKCFNESPRDTIAVGDDPMTTTFVHKSAFRKRKNDAIDYEPMVKCIHCGREMHKICVLHHENIWPEGFQCNSCLKAKGTVRKENNFSAKRLPTTKLATFLEDRVNTFLHTMEADAGVITIRTVSSSDKILKTCALMKDRFLGDFPEQFPYRTKAVFVFQEIDGVDVCFFGMHVQEYGSDCQAPNRRRVYISHLDSVHFFRPCHLRTQVYHEILNGYLEFCKYNGYLTAHIWACPHDDYIFNCHPVEQKIPKPKQLTDWFRKMLDIGKSEGVVWDYWDIFKHCTEDGMTSVTVTEIPYFKGDFWPKVIEEDIKELDQEAVETEISEQASGEGHTRRSKKAREHKSSKNASLLIGGDNLSQRLYQTMQKYKEVFFVVLLQPPLIDTSSPLPSTTDPDQLINCYLMDGRDAFLTMCREQHWEFSSLRRAKFSSMAMLYEIHNHTSNRFVYICNNCHMHMEETRYRCRECNDFDLCASCYCDIGHVHVMDKFGPGDELQQNKVQKDPREQRKVSIQKCIQFLEHACHCRDPMCMQPSCIKMKRVLRHTRDCKLRRSGKCTICKQFLLLCYSHAKSCINEKCPVPICARIKKNLCELRARQQMRQDRFSQQRMINMSHNHQASSTASPAPAHTLFDNSKNTPPSIVSTANNPPTSTNTVPTSTVAPSPVDQRSTGEGDPMIPGDTHTPGQQSILMGSSSPTSLLHAVPQPSSPLEQSMLVHNIAVSTGPPEQNHISQQQATMENVQQILSTLRQLYQIQKQWAMFYLQQHPELTPRVQALAHEQSEAIPQELLPQEGSTLTYQQAFTGIPEMNPMATVGEYKTPPFPSAAGHAETAHSTIHQSPEHWLSPVIHTHDDTFPTVPSAAMHSDDDP